MDRTATFGLVMPVVFALVLGSGCGTVDRTPSTPTTPDLGDVTVLRVVGPVERTISVRELRAGIEIPIDVVVPSGATALRAAPLDGGGCQRADRNGLILFPVVRRGEDIVYCPACDVGYCPADASADAPSPRPGTHRYVFRWKGEIGSGPSHYARPLGTTPGGDEIEPGKYDVTVTMAFRPPAAPLKAQPRKSEASFVIRIMP